MASTAAARPDGAGLRRGPLLALVALATGVVAGRLVAGDLVGDPVIYAALAKAMVQRGDWGTLFLAGKPFFDKPPLVIWLTALSFETFGVTTWSARLAGAVPGVLACLVLARLGTLLAGPDVGLAAGAILALTPGFVRFASTLLLDPMMLLAALLALLAMARAWERGGRGLWRAGAWLGVAFLAKGALALIAVPILPVLWVATPAASRPPARALVAAAVAFLAVVLPWHLYELAQWDGAFVRGYLYDVQEKMGGHPPLATYLRALGVTTLPWLPLAALGAWRAWRPGAGRWPALRLLVVWTAVAYGALLLAGKHSPRYLMLLHPAVALWAALAVAPVLGRRVAPAVAMVAALAWLAILVWPHPFHPSGTGAAVVALAPELGPPQHAVIGFRLRHEGTRARFAYYLDRDVETSDDIEALAALSPGTPVVTAARDARVLVADGRFRETARSRDFVTFRVGAPDGTPR